MPGVHKHPTISFRVNDYQKRDIDAKIKASGMSKQDYFVKSCIYNRVCVVGKKETIYPLLEEIQILQTVIKDIAEQFSTNNVTITEQGLKEIKDEYLSLLKAILWMLDGAKYLWTDNNKIC